MTYRKVVLNVEIEALAAGVLAEGGDGPGGADLREVSGVGVALEFAAPVDGILVGELGGAVAQHAQDALPLMMCWLAELEPLMPLLLVSSPREAAYPMEQEISAMEMAV